MSASLGPALRNMWASKDSRTMVARIQRPMTIKIWFGIKPSLWLAESGITSSHLNHSSRAWIHANALRIQIVPGTHISDPSLIAQNYNFRSAFDRCSIFRACGRGLACTQLGVDDLARSVGMQRTGNSADHTFDLSLFRSESTFPWQQDSGKKPEDNRAVGNATDSRNQ